MKNKRKEEETIKEHLDVLIKKECLLPDKKCVHKNDVNENKNVGHCDEYQKKFIESEICDAKLLGIPGGGKTKTIIDRILYLFKNKTITKNDEFLVLTFSKQAKNDFLRKATLLNSKLFNNNNIRTIHSLSGTIVSHLINRQTKSIEVIVLVAMKLVKEKDEDKLKEIKELNNLKLIFVDEAQDISELYYNFLVALKTKLHANLILIGDPNQNIYQFKNGSDKYLLTHPGEVFYLNINYRSAQEIVDFIDVFKPWKEYVPKMISYVGPTKKKPNILITDMMNIKKDIINEIFNYKNNKKNIAIIGPVKFAKLYGNTYKSIGLQLVANWLEINNINFLRHYSLSSIEDENNVLDFKDNHVNLMTIHGCKGLEFDKVLLINFHHQTFSKNPTEEDYISFEYLWYVALSRAKNELKIYVDNRKKIFKKIKQCPEYLYTTNKKITECNFPFDNKKADMFLSITNIINNKKIFSEEVFEFINDNFTVNYKDEKIYNVSKNINFDDNIFLGIFFEYIYIYYSSKYSQVDHLKELITTHIDYINNLIDIPLSFLQTAKQLGLYDLFKTITLEKLNQYKNLSNDAKMLYQYVKNKINETNKQFSFFVENDIVEMNKNTLLEICNNILNKTDPIYNLFILTKFVYQYKTESKNLLNHIDIDILISLKHWIKKIGNYVKSTANIPKKFHVETKHVYLNLIGEIDLLENNKIVELKFTKDITDKHFIQTLLYYNNYNVRWEKEMEFSVLNMRTGIKRNYNVVPKISNFNFMMYICKITGLIANNPIIIYDLETSGLDTKNADIIERHFHDYLTNSIVSSGLIKPKANISSQIEQLTHITNEMLANAENLEIFVNEIKTVYDYSIDPIFIAHNGNVFDHIILKNKNILRYDKKYLLDSKLIIRFFSKIDTFNKTLSYTYEIICGKRPSNAHRAFADVEMLIEIFDLLKISQNDIMNIAL